MDGGFVITTDWEDAFEKQLDVVERLVASLKPDKIILIHDESRHSHRLATSLRIRMNKSFSVESIVSMVMPCFNEVTPKDGIVSQRGLTKIKKGLSRIKPTNGDLAIILCPSNTAKVIWILRRGFDDVGQLCKVELKAPANAVTHPMVVNFG